MSLATEHDSQRRDVQLSECFRGAVRVSHIGPAIGPNPANCVPLWQIRVVSCPKPVRKKRDFERDTTPLTGPGGHAKADFCHSGGDK